MTRLVGLAQLARRIAAAPPKLGDTRLVCIDGPAGSGKTTLAGELRRELADATGQPVPVVHMDDLYGGWETALEDAADRLVTQVLLPLAEHRPGRYQRYDWHAGRFAEWQDVPVAPVLIVEGVASAPRAAAPNTTLLVWVEAPEEVRLARGLDRDGEALRPQWERWMRQEREYAERERARERADLVVDGC
jgi:uridine kinase